MAEECSSIVLQDKHTRPGVYQKTHGQKAHPDDCPYLYSEFGDCFVKRPQTDQEVKPLRTVVWP